MPSSITIFKIFLSSPSDVQNERTAVEEVIQEINLNFGKPNNLRLELLKWETHSAPGVSEMGVQQVVSSDIGSDYDVFIGILWKKFGTPTKKANSGTEEEFLDAYKRYQESPKRIQILFYFKDTPIPPSEIVPSELLKIQEFKKDISSNKNILYWSYETIEQLSKYLRHHLPKRILQIKESPNIQSNTSFENTDVIETNTEGELGILDYQEAIEEHMRDTKDFLHRLSEATAWIGKEVSEKASEIDGLTLGGNQPSRKEIKEVLGRTASIMNNYARKVKPEILMYHEHFQKSIQAFSNLIILSKEDFEIDPEEIEITKVSIISLKKSVTDTIFSMSSFLEAITSLPRLSKELNRAKTNVSIEVKTLISNLNANHEIAEELLKKLE
ncbi:MAG: DUF4062 domain-containing protein [Bacteroidota bacterium]